MSEQLKYPSGHRSRFQPGPEHKALIKGIPESDIMQTMIEMAQQSGWKVYHTYRSDKSEPGFPDLCCVKGKRLLFIEAKSSSGRPSMDQVRWLLALARVPGVECYAWDGTDLDYAAETFS